MNLTSLLEESNSSIYGDEEIKFMEEEGGSSKRNAVSTDYEKSLSNQRERSVALNSEGLDGLIPRAKLLLSIGGTFFFGFWPLILVTIASFSALYLVSFFCLIFGVFHDLLWFDNSTAQICLIFLH
ncbi:uncharacterized protein LOC114265128 [Camellia sinensis]|uniref:uncharacterized protein LOC114265128 n=1 Tax=Camellia sinensis TaxID=4442 RepID=UPI0010358751|nr:uncharacterized protein LOC114265128 [Camellia sinensis]